MRKFVIVKTKHTQEEIDEILKTQSPEYIDILKDLYDSFTYVEMNKLGTNWVVMYAILDDYDIHKLCKHYVNLGLTFIFIDYTKKVLFNTHKIAKDSVYMEPEKTIPLEKLKHNFRENELTVDIVLDKINKLGSEKLDDIDKKVLLAI